MSTMHEELPCGLRWEAPPASWRVDDAGVVANAAGSTDNFVDPAGSVTVLNGAKALALVPDGPWQLSARVSVAFGAAYDAGLLMIWSDERHFAKLCLECAPGGEATIVSVVTRDVSDDANAWAVEHPTAWLRISRLADGAYAFHAGDDGEHWSFVRYFDLTGEAPMRCGIAVQSPIGQGCSAMFSDLDLAQSRLEDMRDGS